MTVGTGSLVCPLASGNNFRYSRREYLDMLGSSNLADFAVLCQTQKPLMADLGQARGSLIVCMAYALTNLSVGRISVEGVESTPCPATSYAPLVEGGQVCPVFLATAPAKR